MEKEITSIYDKVASNISKIYEQQTHIKWIKELAENLPKGGRILDLGCGQGNDGFLFNKFGFGTIGIDGSAGIIKEAKKDFLNQHFWLWIPERLNFQTSLLTLYGAGRY